MRLPLLLIFAAMSTASGQSFVVEKPAFRDLVPEDATVEKLAGGFQFAEGPAWNRQGSFLIFSDIPADKIYRYDPATKAVTVFREPSRPTCASTGRRETNFSSPRARRSTTSG